MTNRTRKPDTTPAVRPVSEEERQAYAYVERVKEMLRRCETHEEINRVASEVREELKQQTAKVPDGNALMLHCAALKRIRLQEVQG